MYKARDKGSRKLVAIKIEEFNSDRMRLEAKILTALHNELGFPKLLDAFDTNEYTCIVLDLLGGTLYDMHKQYRNLQLSTILEVAL